VLCFSAVFNGLLLLFTVTFDQFNPSLVFTEKNNTPPPLYKVTQNYDFLKYIELQKQDFFKTFIQLGEQKELNSLKTKLLFCPFVCV